MMVARETKDRASASRSSAWRVAFWAYAVALFVATHYPRLAIDAPVAHTDKMIHVVAFFIWSFLLGRALNAGSPERISYLQLLAISSIYAVIDESLQAIPALGRTFSIADMAANLIGVTLGVLVLILWRRGIARFLTP